MDALALDIDKRLPTPAYLQLKEQLHRAIVGGALAAGSALPSERELATHLGLSRMTVRRAFEELVGSGYLEQRQGSGTYVRGGGLEQQVDRVLGFTDEARHLGFTPGSRLLGGGRVVADARVAEALDLAPTSTVLRIARLRTADGEPLAIQIAHLIPSLADLPLDRVEAEGLYTTLRARYALTPHRARQTIAARLPTREERRVLAISSTTPVLALERTTFDSADHPFEFVRSAYRGDRYRMALDLRTPP